MRHHVFAAAMLSTSPLAYAAEDITVQSINVRADKPTAIDNIVVVDNTQAQNRTLGGMLEHVSGVQSSAFGPHAGAPVIRSLSGSRVQILEDGQSILGMNALSGDINIAFEPLFVRSVTVNKSSDSVRFGGNAIGGSVDVDSGLISRTMESTQKNLEFVLRKGYNDTDAQGLRMNFNDQQHFSTNLQMSFQKIAHYAIAGNSKAGVCNSQLFPAQGGVNIFLSDSCQKEARIQQVYNKASQPFIDQFMTENPDWADGDFSFYTNKPTSVWQRKTYVNPANPAYVAGTPSMTQNKINKDVTPDYHGTLGNSYASNSHFAVGSTYFFDRGYVAVSIDTKNSAYGVPGFSMENKSFGAKYDAALPVGVVIQQDKYALEALLREPVAYIESAQLRVSRLSNASAELLGSARANDYRFDTRQAELMLAHRRAGPLSGSLGLSHKARDIAGSGSQLYLPDASTMSRALFVKESLDFDWATFDAGLRHEKVEHEIRKSGFKTSRNASNSQLNDKAFSLNSYSLGASAKLGQLFGAKLRYTDSERAPDINELYASNRHYSILAQEEGNQNLKAERASNTELTGLFGNGGFKLSATGYVMQYENYLYLGHSGAQMANRLPLKYWKQTDTTVKGFELDVSQDVQLGNYGKLNLSAFADLVKNKADNPDKLRAHNDGEYLPNMPTNRYGANLLWQNKGWKARVSSTYYAKQKYLGKSVGTEVPLDCYTMLNFQLSRELQVPNSPFAGVEVFISGTNLLDEDARAHNSPLKYIAPLPGRSFQIGLSARL
ncbi:iron complex outermembrane receptor protein [Janthinobacterium sp. CAN_S7]